MPLASTAGSLSARGFGLFGAVKAFTPLSLFASGEQGAWYDPSDLTTMFQDSAGTTPVGTPGNGSAQPVGKILDKSGRGNHATQSTGSARPELSAKYNLLTYTEDFTNAAWSKFNSSISANATTDPLGGSTADKIVESATTNRHGAEYATTGSYNIQYKLVCYLKNAGRQYGGILLNGTSANYSGAAVFDLNAGTVGATNTIGGATVSASISSAGNGWYLCSLTVNLNNASSGSLYFGVFTSDRSDFSGTISFGFPSYAGNGTDGVYAWGADLRVSNDGVGLPAYQRVVDSATYDSTGFPYYLNFDGVDDAMLTTSTVALANFSSYAVFRPNSTTQSSAARVFEYGANNGFNCINNGGNIGFSYNYGSGGNLTFSPAVAIDVKRFLFAFQGNTSKNLLASARSDTANSSYSATSGASQMAASETIYVNRYGGYPTSYNWNSRLYQLCITSSYVSTTTDSQMKSYLNGKFFIY